MIDIQKVDTSSKQQVNSFVQFHYDLYKGHPQWVPPFMGDIKNMLNRKKHPYYEHSDADFFLARRDGKVVGRIGVLQNNAFNDYHGTKKANFYLFDTINDAEVAAKLFEVVFDWCKQRGLDTLIGPKGFSLFDGYGVQIEGFDHRQMMTMMNYNYPYYAPLLEGLGFEKEVDFVSCYLSPERFKLSEKAREVARRVAERGKFKVIRFRNKRELIGYAKKIGDAYNKTFVKNWEYWPMTEKEIKYVVDSVLLVAVPDLIKLMTYNDEVVGFLFGFPDVSKALQRHGGKITPWGLLDIMRELKSKEWISLNGAGVLPDFQGRGGNALMYYEMEKTILDYGYHNAELTQVAETAVQMRKDLITQGGVPYKNHRVFRRAV